MSKQNLGECFAQWAQHERSVFGLVLLGSRLRSPTDGVLAPDAYSDWDFMIVTNRPGRFFNPGWISALPSLKLRAYAVRRAGLTANPKIHMAFAGAEAEAVVVTAKTMRFAKLAVALRLHRRITYIRRGLQNLAIVFRPGWKSLKGARTWDAFYRKVVEEVPDPRLTDDDVRQLADIFVYDYLSIRRKLARGELAAAQRLLHRNLTETNFQLLHEGRLRRGAQSLPEAKRLEKMVGPEELAAVSVDARRDAAELAVALEHCAETLRELTHALVADRWRWPNVN